MRIRELLESHGIFNELQFVKSIGKDRELDFDLPKDLIFFMHDNDTIYRKYLHPVIATCIDRQGSNKKTTNTMFKPAVEAAYAQYIKQFPIRELPKTLEHQMLLEICNELHEETTRHIADGRYK